MREGRAGGRKIRREGRPGEKDDQERRTRRRKDEQEEGGLGGRKSRRKNEQEKGQAVRKTTRAKTNRREVKQEKESEGERTWHYCREWNMFSRKYSTLGPM